MRHAQLAIRHLTQLGKTIVRFQRIAAGGHEIDHTIERLAQQPRIRQRGSHFAIERARIEWRLARHAHDMLRQHVERTGSVQRHILLARIGRIHRRAALQNLEPVRRHQQRLRGLVEPVICPPYPLRQAARTLWRADVDDEIDIAPVNSKIQRRRAHHRPQFARRHRRFDLAPLHLVE